MNQELEFLDREIVEYIQDSSEPEWMKNQRSEAKSKFLSLPNPSFKYGINIILNPTEVKFEEIKLPEKKKIVLPINNKIVIKNLSEALKTHEDLIKKYLFSTLTSLTKFESLHKMLWNKGIVIYIPKNTVIKEPIKIKNVNNNFDFQHNLIIIDENSSISIFEEDLSENNEKSYNTKVTEIFVNRDSKLNYATFQNLSQKTVSFSSKKALVNQNANITWIDFNLGSSLSKSEMSTNLQEEGSSTNVFSLFFSNNAQQFDFNSSIFHNARYTNSDMAVNGVLDNKSKVIYNGLVKIHKNAKNSNGCQKQDALLLSPDAEIDPIPNLEIDNNDVKCFHGTTVSQIDKEKLFYLKSRGIPEKDAVNLMIKGFFDPVIEKINIKEAQEDLRNAIASKL
ncbi:Fe-S cluster assembly protein SufD [Candidatus Woesearchaeota archaeon]|nr:Fe-S cluster assembly protein SufD [Candidatus Woesearchaeota archaeon]